MQTFSVAFFLFHLHGVVVSESQQIVNAQCLDSCCHVHLGIYILVDSRNRQHDSFGSQYALIILHVGRVGAELIEAEVVVHDFVFLHVAVEGDGEAAVLVAGNGVVLELVGLPFLGHVEVAKHLVPQVVAGSAVNL